MAFSPLYHLHHQAQSLHHSSDPNSNYYFNHANNSMPFSVTDILHHQAVLNNNLSNYNNSGPSSSSVNSTPSLPINNTNQLEDSFNMNHINNQSSKKHGMHHANSAIITPPSYSNNQISNNDSTRPVNSNNNAINIIPPCTPSPSIHSPVNNGSSNSSYNPTGAYSSFNTPPNTLNHTDQTTAALAYLNTYGN